MAEAQLIVTNWRDAIFSLISKDQKDLQAYAQFSTDVIELFHDYPQLLKILTNAQLSKQERKEIIIRIFKDNVPKNALNMLCLLVDHNYFKLVTQIAYSLRKRIDGYTKVSYARVYTISPLSQIQIDKLKLKLEKKYNMSIKILNLIDKNVLGGIKVIINNSIVLDGTVKTKLDTLRKQIIEKKVD